MTLVRKFLKIFQRLDLQISAVHITDEIAIYLREHILNVLFPGGDDEDDVALNKHEDGEGECNGGMFAKNTLFLPVLPNDIRWRERFFKVH